MRAGRIADLAPLLDASHESMRDDFEITVPQVDLAVEVARASGALGARMTGGGFGGCIIALVAAGESERIGGEIARKLRSRWIRSADALHGRSIRRRSPPAVERIINRFDRIPNRPASIKPRHRVQGFTLSSGPNLPLTKAVKNA